METRIAYGCAPENLRSEAGSAALKVDRLRDQPRVEPACSGQDCLGPKGYRDLGRAARVDEPFRLTKGRTLLLEKLCTETCTLLCRRNTARLCSASLVMWGHMLRGALHTPWSVETNWLTVRLIVQAVGKRQEDRHGWVAFRNLPGHSMEAARVHGSVRADREHARSLEAARLNMSLSVPDWSPQSGWHEFGPEEWPQPHRFDRTYRKLSVYVYPLPAKFTTDVWRTAASRLQHAMRRSAPSPHVVSMV